MKSEEFTADLVEILFVEPDELTDDTDLLDIGLTSINLARLVDRWKSQGVHVNGKPVEFSVLAEGTTVGRWRELLIA